MSAPHLYPHCWEPRKHLHIQNTTSRSHGADDQSLGCWAVFPLMSMYSPQELPALCPWLSHMDRGTNWSWQTPTKNDQCAQHTDHFSAHEEKLLSVCRQLSHSDTSCILGYCFMMSCVSWQILQHSPWTYSLIWTGTPVSACSSFVSSKKVWVIPLDPSIFKRDLSFGWPIKPSAERPPNKLDLRKSSSGPCSCTTNKFDSDDDS